MAYTLLLADDDLTVLNLLKKELEARGYIVLTAPNGLAALHQVKKNKPDLVILDVAMPMTSGVKAYETLRSNPETQKIPIIFLTAMPSGDIYPVISQGTRVAHLKKPVDVADLLSLIHQFLPA